MKINKILVVLVIIQVGIITLGGYLYTLIPNNIEQIENQDDLPSCTINQTDSIAKSNHTITKSYIKPSFSDSVFFVITIITTIGYGQLTPKTDVGKIFTIIIAFIGIPINIVFLAKIGEFLKKGSAYLLNPVQRFSTNKKFFIIFQLIFSIISGTIIFLLIPGLIIMKLEDWTYIDSLYYTFVTLFTIGFGDFVAGSELKLNTLWLNLYRFVLYLWMYLGMAYISLIITLCLDYFKANAENLRKEVINIIEEKINLSIRRYLAAKKFQFKSKNKLSKNTSEGFNEQIAKEGIKIKLNYSNEKLEDLARRRSKYKSHNNLREYFNQSYQTNALINQAFELSESNQPNKELDFKNLDKLEEIPDEIDDDCIKVIIENENDNSNGFINQLYESTKYEDVKFY